MEKALRVTWKQMTEGMFGDHVKWEEIRVYSTFDVGSPRFSDAEMGFDDRIPTETVPRRGFFGLFGPKPATPLLFSVHDAFTAQKEGRRLLEKMGVQVSIPHSANLGLLKCRLDELRDPAGVMGAVKPARFRVEIFYGSPPDFSG